MSLRSRIRDEELGPYSTHPAYAFANIRRAFVLAGSFSLLVVGLALLGLWQWSSKLTLAEIIDKLLNGQAAGVIGGIIFAVAIPVASALLTYLICLRLASQPGNRRSPLDAYATLVTAAVVVAGLVFLMWLTLGVFKDADTQASILGALSLVTFAALMLVMWVAEGFDLSTLAKAVFGLRSFTVFGTSIAVWWALMQGIFNATTVPMLKYLVSSDTARAFVPAVTLLPVLAGFALTVKKWFIPAVLRAASESAKADHIDEEAATQGLDRPTPIQLGADAFPQPKRPAVSNAVPQESTPADDESSGEPIKASSEPPPPGFADSLKGWYEEQFGASVRHTVQITPSEQTCTVADAQDLSVFFGGPPTEDQERFMRTAERNAERTLTDPEASGDLLLHGPEGSGRTTSLLALAITACIDPPDRTCITSAVHTFDFIDDVKGNIAGSAADSC
jgi:hypothetical protein